MITGCHVTYIGPRYLVVILERASRVLCMSVIKLSNVLLKPDN